MPSTAFKLRDYQHQAIEAIHKAQRQGLKRVLISLPTGAGKTVIFSELCKRTGAKTLVLAHREELLEQAKEKIQRAVGGESTVEIEQAQKHSSPSANIVVASIRSLRTDRINRLISQHSFKLIIYDECHHSAAEDNKRVLSELGCFSKKWDGMLVGFTATPTRSDGIGLEEVFERIIFDRNILDLIRAGYLVPLKGYRIQTGMEIDDLTGINPSIEMESIEIESRNGLVARSIQELARDRRTICFCTTVIHAKNLAKELNKIGLPTGIVWGAMSKDSRKETLGQFKAGALSVITNVGVLIEGFDDPGVSCIAMARPTKSPALYAQCVGRGSRLALGKEDCIILDFVDASSLGLVTLPSLFGFPTLFDLEGEDIAEVDEKVQKWMQLDLGFEIESTDITLAEIQRRAEHFDPLSKRVHPEIRAISGNGWFSLGAKGLGLHFWRGSGELSLALILKKGNKYNVTFNSRPAAQFTKIIQAVEAVDYEIEQLGESEAASALTEAAWRHMPTPPQIKSTLANLKPPRTAHGLADALGHLVYADHHPPKRRKPKLKKGWPRSMRR